mgnify:CR=1 FL=1
MRKGSGVWVWVCTASRKEKACSVYKKNKVERGCVVALPSYQACRAARSAPRTATAGKLCVVHPCILRWSGEVRAASIRYEKIMKIY